MIQQVYYFLCGYLYVRFTGHNVKRLLNLCVQNDIGLWDISYVSEQEYRCRLLWRDIYRLVPHLRKTRTKVRVFEKKGFPYQKFKYRKRYLWFLSLAVLAITTYILSGRIWKIEVIGNSEVSIEEMLRFLEKHHASYNSPKNKVNCAKLELELRKQMDEVIWASIYMKGTKLVVEIQESLQNEVQERGGRNPNDIVATKDAVIASIVTRAGVPKVVKGESVKANDLLVQSSYPIVNDDDSIDQYVYMDSDADIKGYVTYQYEDTLPISEIVKEKTGNKYSRYHIQIGERMLKSPSFLKKYKETQQISNTVQLCLVDNFYLPIYKTKEDYYELKEVTVHYSQKDAKEQLSNKFYNFLDELEKNGVLIISKNVIMEKKGEIYYMHGTIQTCEDIGEKVQANDKNVIHQEDTEN